MKYVINGKPYWSVRVPSYAPLPMADGSEAQFYVFRPHPSPAATMISGYLARAESGLWRAYDVCGRPISDQEHRAMALCDVARRRESHGQAIREAQRELRPAGQLWPDPHRDCRHDEGWWPCGGKS